MSSATDRQMHRQAEQTVSALELACEQAYRRGFAQGAYLALRQVRQGHSEARLARWFESVTRWRYNLRWVKAVYTNEQFKALPPELPELARPAGRAGK